MRQENESAFEKIAKIVAEGEEAYIQRRDDLGVPQGRAEEEWDALLYFKEVELRSERLNEIRLAGIPEEFRNN